MRDAKKAGKASMQRTTYPSEGSRVQVDCIKADLSLGSLNKHCPSRFTEDAIGEGGR